MSGVSCNSSRTRVAKETIAVRDRTELTEQDHNVPNETTLWFERRRKSNGVNEEKVMIIRACGLARADQLGLQGWATATLSEV